MMAASVLAGGLGMEPVQALPLRGAIASPHLTQTEPVQHKQKGKRKPGQHGRKGEDHGFVASCQWLRARALTSHNPAWWRKYRQCIER
jgi:hypothetical protein